MARVRKPKTRTIVAYEWGDIEKYIQAKYKRNLRDWEGRWTEEWAEKWGTKDFDERPYHDFWHWMIEHYSPGNGCVVDIYPKATMEESGPDLEPWVCEILTILRDEFGDEFKLLTEW
jgi:hypothetical protein